MKKEMSYNPRSVPLPVPRPQSKCVHGIAQRIYNLLSIAANCIEEYENPERGHMGDDATKGNLSEFEGSLESAIAHWLFLFEAESLLDEETQARIKENIARNAKYNAEPDFERASRLMMQYLNNNHHPHTEVRVTHTNAEVLEGQISFNTDDYLKD